MSLTPALSHGERERERCRAGIEPDFALHGFGVEALNIKVRRRKDPLPL